jgi:predicted DNA-binding protein with PD1-like motif
MEYTSARMGRIFVARVDHGEDLLQELQKILVKEGVTHGFMLLLGALKEGSVVTGPAEAVIPPVPHYVGFGGGWELIGAATFYPGEDGPAIHLHASVGRGERSLTGCLRGKAETYLVMEVVILELTGLSVRRVKDDRTGLVLPDFGA